MGNAFRVGYPCAHLYDGTGNPWAGQTIVKLRETSTNCVREESPEVMRGIVLETGSGGRKELVST